MPTCRDNLAGVARLLRQYREQGNPVTVEISEDERGGGFYATLMERRGIDRRALIEFAVGETPNRAIEHLLASYRMEW